MCWFLTIAVPQAHRDALHRRLAEHSTLHSTDLSTTPTVNVFPAGAACVEVIQGWCSCDLYCAPPAPGHAEGQLARGRQRMEKKGWSASKIERALKAKTESGQRSSRSNDAAEAFRALITEVVGEIGAVDLFAHFYSGNQHEEPVGSPKLSTVSLPQFLETGFPPDIVVTVRAAG